MAELFNNGFEEGDFSAWTGTLQNGTGNTITVQDTIKYAGTWAAKAHIQTGSGYGLAYKTLTMGATTYMRVYAQVSALPASGNLYWLFKIRDTTNSKDWRVGIYNVGGTLKWFILNEVAGAYYTYDETMLVDTWYCLELKVVIDGSAGECRLWRNGTEIITETGINTGSNNPTRAYIGYQSFDGTAGDYYTDCVVVADAYIGCEAVGVPIAVMMHHYNRINKIIRG